MRLQPKMKNPHKWGFIGLDRFGIFAVEMKGVQIIFITYWLCGGLMGVRATNHAAYDSMQLLNEVVIAGKVSLVTPYVTSTHLSEIELSQNQIQAIKDVSLFAPNLYMPDYGSRMTSAMYVRGLGARMDQPAVGLLLDGIPVFNKNTFDGRLGDLQHIKMIRGPQSTLYGRNTMGGVIAVQTLSPKYFQGRKVQLEASSGNTFGASFSQYSKLDAQSFLSVSAYGGRSDGLFTNTYNGSSCDAYQEFGGRLKWEYDAGGIEYLHHLSGSWLDQSGYPYRRMKHGVLEPIQYNRPSGYERWNGQYGLGFNKHLDENVLSGTTSFQSTKDEMLLDQDFTVDDFFTIRQSQTDFVLSQDVTYEVGKGRDWSRLFGFNIFARHLETQAPVSFMRLGIDSLILANANRGLKTVFPNGAIEISDSSFLLSSDFRQPSLGLALYHQSSVKLNNWTLHAGLRLDYESAWLTYRNASQMNYRFNMTMPEFRLLKTNMEGDASIAFLELLPSVAGTWQASDQFSVTVSLSKGFKSGGFNTQLFSDLLKNKVMSDMMSDMGIQMHSALDNYSVSDVVAYKPEHSWNYELKMDVHSSETWAATVTGFYIDCLNQQLTVFPSGLNTGRMMTNAGKTRSFGVESESFLKWNHFKLQAAYGYTHAQFVSYDNGVKNFAGKRIPYAPEQTLHVSLDHCAKIEPDVYLLSHVGYQGCGTIWWTEENDNSQPFYGITDASLTLNYKQWSLQLWGKNLTNTDYNTFYFISMGNAFLQKGRPFRMGATLKWTFTN